MFGSDMLTPVAVYDFAFHCMLHLADSPGYSKILSLLRLAKMAL